jgi:phage tail sheath protein FI
MPEYLHPGVYIEETSFRGKPIEGVSTSTAGLVGRATKGPEGKPTLVTSYAQFRRDFGEPVPIVGTANPGDYLGHAVRSFFENGGLRAYIVRALAGDATTAAQTLKTGGVWLLATNKVLRPTQTVIPLGSARDLKVNDDVRLTFRGPAGWGSPATAWRTITAVDVVRGEITVAALTAADFWAGATATDSVGADGFYLVRAAPVTHAAVPPAATGPTFRARYRGLGGNDLAVQIRSADRPAMAVRTATLIAGSTLELASVGGFYVGAIVEITRGGSTRDYLTVTAVDAVTRRVDLSGNTSGGVATTDVVCTLELDVLVYEKGALKESFTGLTWNPDPLASSFSRYYVDRVNDPTTGSTLVRVVTTATLPFPPPPAVSLPAPQPPAAVLTAAGQPTTDNGFAVALGGGSDGATLSNTDLIGVDGGPGARTGIEALRERDDIALVAVPGVIDRSVQSALLIHCELLKYRFAVLDGVSSSDVTAIQIHRNNYDSKYGGYYTPWLTTMDLATGRGMVVPPSGHVLGICARVDNERGVHKAPANEVVRGITGLTLPFGNGEQDVLNERGINLIREFDGRGIRVWGGRCTTSDTEWKYVNVRRLFIFLEHSIDRGTQWVVFEPNNEALWQRVVETIDSFLFGIWKSGALMGTKPEEAYFVRCDRTTMTQDDIDNGRLVCLIGVAPAFPAEFVIFRIGQFTASSNRA